MGTKRSELVERVWKEGEGLAHEAGLELVDVDFRKEGGSWRLTVVLDKGGGVTTEDCEAFSERLGRYLDAEDAVEVPYFLEVSSPGIERPLKRPRDYQAFAGRTVEVRTFEPVGGRRRFFGVLEGIEGETVRLKGEDGTLFEIPLERISRANLKVDWERALK